MQNKTFIFALLLSYMIIFISYKQLIINIINHIFFNFQPEKD